MKFLVIFLIMGMAMFVAYNDAFGWCDQNEDWPDAPCYAPYQAQQIESQEDWEKYYDYKGSKWMDSKKLELIHAIQTDMLDEWIAESDDQSHENVYVYYSIFDDLEEYKISAEPNIKLTPFVLYFQEEDFTTQGPNHNILVLEQGESAAVTVHVKNNDDVPHRITLKNLDSDSSVFSSFVFEPKEILVLPNGTNSTKLHMTIANKTDTHTTFVTFLGQGDSFGMRGLGFYLAVEKEDRGIDYEFIDRSMRAGLPGGAFPDLDTDISEHDAEISISNGFGSPRYLPDGYKFQGMDGWENKRFVYSKAPILTESTGFQQFWDEDGILIIYGVDGPNVNNTASLPFRVAQNEGQQVMINGLMGDAVENHTRTVAYSDIEYGVPSDVYFFDDAKKASVFLRANIPLDELLKVAASIPVPNAVSTNYFSEQGYKIFSVVEGAYQYNVPYKITGAKFSSMDLDCDGTEIIVGLESSGGGTLVVNIPRKMLDTRFNDSDDEFFVILDGKEIAFDEIYSNVESRTLKIPFSKDSQVLEIIITQIISQDPKSQVTCGQMGPEESPYYDLLSPLKQFEQGIPLNEIQCKGGLELLIKSSDGSPACVKPGNKSKLVERGWAFKSYQSYLVQPKITTSAKNQTGLITWKNQTYYFEIPYYTQDAYTNQTQVSVRDVVFTLFPQPFGGGLPTGGCGGSYYWADAKFSDGTSELLKIFVNSRPCPDDSIPIAVSNHANPQAGMTFINGSFRLLVSDDSNESDKDVYESDSPPKREITIISISPQNVTLPDKKNQTYKTTCNEQGVCFTPE